MEEEKVLGFIQSAVELAEQRFGQLLKAETGEVRREMNQMELRLRVDTAELRHEMRHMEGRLKADMDERETRLIENIRRRREDIDAVFGDIESLRQTGESTRTGEVG